MWTLHNDKQLLQKSRDTLKNINICNRMKSLNPLDKHHLTILILTHLQLITYRINQLIQIKHKTFVKWSIDDVFEQVINFLWVIFYVVGKSCSDETNNFVEDVKEMFVAKDAFFASFDDVEHGVASCLLYFLIFVIETFDYWWQDLFEIL